MWDNLYFSPNTITAIILRRIVLDRWRISYNFLFLEILVIETDVQMKFRVFWDVLRLFWWWKQYASLKRRSTYTWLHVSTSQKTLNFIHTAVRTWNLTTCECFPFHLTTACYSFKTNWRTYQQRPISGSYDGLGMSGRSRIYFICATCQVEDERGRNHAPHLNGGLFRNDRDTGSTPKWMARILELFFLKFRNIVYRLLCRPTAFLKYFFHLGCCEDGDERSDSGATGLVFQD
jgi:hypothetical protein